MLSRVAERMYWAGRYLERAENVARLVKVQGYMLLDLPPAAGRSWEQLLTIFDNQELFNSLYDEPNELNIIRFFVADPDNPGSIASSLAALRENIRTTRDIVPTEGWECVNELHLFAGNELAANASALTMHQSLSQTIARCQQLTGLFAGTMSNGKGYNFIRLGRNLERADMTTRVLDVPAASLLYADEELEPFKNSLWMNVLKSLSAYQMYCQHVRRRVIGDDVIRFLLHDPLFPRSLEHCKSELSIALQTLPRHEAALQELNELEALLNGEQPEVTDPARLHDFLDALQFRLGSIHKKIAATWFLPTK